MAGERAARGRHLADGTDDWSRPRLNLGNGTPRRPLTTYSMGTEPAWHPRLIEKTADIAVAAMPVPIRVLDIGCGNGALLDELVARVPDAEAYVGLDPLPDVLAKARPLSDVRISFVRGAAEALPFADGTFDLVVASLSLTHWRDQRAGTVQLARVLSDNGVAVLVDVPDAGAMRSARGIPGLLADAGLRLRSTEVVQRSRLLRRAACAFVASP
jgi:SAM-dependent methyltransferase